MIVWQKENGFRYYSSRDHQRQKVRRYRPDGVSIPTAIKMIFCIIPVILLLGFGKASFSLYILHCILSRIVRGVYISLLCSFIVRSISDILFNTNSSKIHFFNKSRVHILYPGKIKNCSNETKKKSFLFSETFCILESNSMNRSL